MLPGMMCAGLLGSRSDTQTVTVGQVGIGGSRKRGYATALGSISPGTSSIFGAAITEISYKEDTGDVVFTVTGGFSNGGFDNMRIGSTDYARSAASYATGASTTWTWAGTASDPYGGVGTSTTVVFS